MARDRRDIAKGKGRADAPALPPVSADDKKLVSHLQTPHPELIRLVRLLARQAAEADIVAQRSERKAVHFPKE
jgi:hypothetical protein